MCFIKHFLDDKAESKKAARSEQTVQDAPQQSEASTGSMKRQSSFETPPSKASAQARDRQWRFLLLVSRSSCPGSSRQMVPVQQSMSRGKPVFYRLGYLFGKTPDKQASPGLSGQQARQRKEQAAEERRQEAEEEAKSSFLFVPVFLVWGVV